MSIIYFIDDDTDVLLINQKYFINAGFDVKTFNNASDALSAIPLQSPDCIVLDVMMPDIDGFKALPKIRSLCSAPIIFLSGKDSEDDRIKGLLSGADDYMIKPYSLGELSARIILQLRKNQKSNDKNLLSFPPLVINTQEHKVFYYEEEIALSNKEYDLLLLLANKSGSDVTYEEIGNTLYQSYIDEDRRSIMVLTSRLRKKLSFYAGLDNAIESLYGKGYKFTLKPSA
ncbi:MAG: response regulator transcription factor [Butyrivibrio sp.]|nr:response regulator transcription factor [Butyrivibrio sp.]